MNDLAEIAREIDSFTTAGKRIPVAVWEKYDRINKRHKKHEDMMAIAAEARKKNKRRTRKREEQGQEAGQGCIADNNRDLDLPDEKERTAFSTDKTSTGTRRHHPVSKNTSSSSSFTADSTELSLERKPNQRTAPCPFQGGGRCTFGSGRGEDEGDALEKLARREAHASTAKSRVGPSSSSWGSQEREKLNEICESDCSNQRLSFLNTSSYGYCYLCGNVHTDLVGLKMISSLKLRHSEREETLLFKARGYTCKITYQQVQKETR